MAGELHLPDLPEVPLSLGVPVAVAGATPPLGGPPVRSRTPRAVRWREMFGAYLPLLLMVLLALFTWWLVKHTPGLAEPGTPGAVRHEPDYTADRFVVQRFDAAGQMVLQFEGDKMRHYPDRNEIEIDAVRLVATTEDGRVTHATARLAIATDDGAQVRLKGNAHVVSEMAGTEPVDIVGEDLLTLVKDQQVRADQPAVVRQGRSQFTAETLEYDQKQHLLALHGKVHGVMLPAPR